MERVMKEAASSFEKSVNAYHSAWCCCDEQKYCTNEESIWLQCSGRPLIQKYLQLRQVCYECNKCFSMNITTA